MTKAPEYREAHWGAVLREDPFYRERLSFYLMQHVIIPSALADVRVAQLTDFKTVKEGSDWHEVTPTLTGSRQQVQSLMQTIVDAAWDNGIFPSKLQSRTRDLKFLENHLSDFRAIVSKTLKVDFQHQGEFKLYD